MIRYCGCTSNKLNNPIGAVFQDQQYGRGQRLHTYSTASGAAIACTVCGQKTKATGKQLADAQSPTKASTKK